MYFEIPTRIEEILYRIRYFNNKSTVNVFRIDWRLN